MIENACEISGIIWHICWLHSITDWVEFAKSWKVLPKNGEKLLGIFIRIIYILWKVIWYPSDQSCRFEPTWRLLYLPSIMHYTIFSVFLLILLPSLLSSRWQCCRLAKNGMKTEWTIFFMHDNNDFLKGARWAVTGNKYSRFSACGHSTYISIFIYRDANKQALTPICEYLLNQLQLNEWSCLHISDGSIQLAQGDNLLRKYS